MLEIYRPLLEALHFRPQRDDEPENEYLRAALIEVAQLPSEEQQPFLQLLAPKDPPR